MIVDIEVILDRQQAANKYSEWKDLKEAGIPVYFSTNSSTSGRGYMHHKYAVIDSQLILTGSFNWTGNAVGYNQENLIALESRELAGAFLSNWSSLPKNDQPPPPKQPKPSSVQSPPDFDE